MVYIFDHGTSRSPYFQLNTFPVAHVFLSFVVIIATCFVVFHVCKVQLKCCWILTALSLLSVTIMTDDAYRDYTSVQCYYYTPMQSQEVQNRVMGSELL